MNSISRVVLGFLALACGIAVVVFLVLAFTPLGAHNPEMSMLRYLGAAVIMAAGLASCGLGLALLDLQEDVARIREIAGAMQAANEQDRAARAKERGQGRG
jgi:uncharacterized membrane protein